MPNVKNRTGLDFIIPAHNEMDTVGHVVEACQDALGHLALEGDVVVIADHCTDKTASIAVSAGAGLIERIGNCGSKAAAVCEGISATSSKYVFLVDGDCLGLEADHLVRIATPVLEESVDMGVGVFDYRFVDKLVHRFPWSTGQRILERSAFNWNDPRLHAYNLEVLINESIGAIDGKTASFIMNDVTQRSKVAKFGLLSGVIRDMSMWRSICTSTRDLDVQNYQHYMRNVILYTDRSSRRQSQIVTDLGLLGLRLARRTLSV